MPYVASIGLYFVPVLCLLGAGWSYVRWKNEEEALSQRARKNCKRFLIAVPVSIAVFLALKLAFPIT